MFEDTQAPTRAVLEDRLQAMVSPEAWAVYLDVERAIGAERDTHEDQLVAELARHFPGIAPAIRALASHIADADSDDVGACCEVQR